MIMQPPALMDFQEPWDGADSTDIGANWRPEFVNCKLVSNRVQLRTPASNTGRQGAWESYVSTGYNGGRLLTDNWAVETPCLAPIGAAATDNGTAIGGAMLDAGPGSGMVLVYAVFQPATSGTTAAIVTYANSSIASPGNTTGQAGQTVRATTTVAFVTTDTMRFERRMYSATQSVFTLYKNGSSYVSWNDSGAVVPAGDRTKRRWYIACEGNFPFLQQAFYSPALASIRAYDLKL